MNKLLGIWMLVLFHADALVFQGDNSAQLSEAVCKNLLGKNSKAVAEVMAVMYVCTVFGITNWMTLFIFS